MPMMLARWASVALMTLALDARGASTVHACDDTHGWPPYTIVTRTASPPAEALSGFTVELLRRVAARRGWELRLTLLPWKRCELAVRNGQLAIALNAVHTTEREREFWMSESLYSTQLLALWRMDRRLGKAGVASLAALKNLRIGGIRGYSYSQLDASTQKRMIRAPNYDSLVRMLHGDRLDVIFINEAIRQALIASGASAIGDERVLGVQPVPEYQPSSFHLLFSRAHPDGARLHAEFSESLEAMARDGELEALRRQWVPEAVVGR